MSDSHPSARPRVCLFISSFHPRVGGGETHARLLARALRGLGTDVWVLTRRHDRRLPRRDIVDGTPVWRVGPAGFPRLGKYLMLPAALGALIRKRASYGLIYVCGLRVIGVAGMLAALWLGKRVVMRAEACGEWSGAFALNRPAGDARSLHLLVRSAVWLRNRLYRRADRFLAISRVIREEYLAGGIPADRIATITNGIDFAVFQPADSVVRAALRAEFQFGSDVVFLYSGKLNRGKGLELLLRAFARVAQEEPRARLVLVGSGGTQYLSCEAELRAYVAERGLEARVLFTGYTDRVADYLRAADVFVFPSESEALGLALIEAMACGCAALASATGGILDIVDDRINGRLLPVGDEDAWRQAMLDAIRQPDQTARWAAAGMRSVRERFAIDEVARQHQRLFQTLYTP